MNGTSSFTSAGVTSETGSMPHAFADDMRRVQLLQALLGARDLDAAALREDAELLVLAHALERELRHLLRVVDREDEVRRVAGRAAGVRERPLVDQHDVAPAELGEVVGEAVADDAGADHDRTRASRAGTGGARLVWHASFGSRQARIESVSRLSSPPPGGTVGL